MALAVNSVTMAAPPKFLVVELHRSLSNVLFWLKNTSFIAEWQRVVISHTAPLKK
jgi:hypothetical protein